MHELQLDNVFCPLVFVVMSAVGGLQGAVNGFGKGTFVCLS